MSVHAPNMLITTCIMAAGPVAHQCVGLLLIGLDRQAGQRPAVCHHSRVQGVCGRCCQL